MDTQVINKFEENGKELRTCVTISRESGWGRDYSVKEVILTLPTVDESEITYNEISMSLIQAKKLRDCLAAALMKDLIIENE